MNILALSADLMDRSKIAAAYPDAQLVRSSSQLIDHAAGVSLVLVDLNRLDDLSVLSSLIDNRSESATDCRVVAFGSHVDETLLAQAAETGAEVLARSVFFRRIGEGTL